MRNYTSVLVFGAGLLSGCASSVYDASLRDLSYPYFMGSKFFVENGRAYHRATLDLGKHTTLVIPDDARVEQGEQVGQVELYLEKVLNDESRVEYLSIRKVREKMGYARKSEGKKLILETYGGRSHRHGGQYINLLVRVPKTITVERLKDLSRSKSKKRRLGRREFAELGVGWEAIPDLPDPTATARLNQK